LGGGIRDGAQSEEEGALRHEVAVLRYFTVEFGWGSDLGFFWALGVLYGPSLTFLFASFEFIEAYEEATIIDGITQRGSILIDF